jgi:peptidoglycan/LPS O-acetylase OafA/YrhL
MVGAVTAVLMVVGMAIAYFSGDTSTGEIVAFFVLTGLWLIAIALLVTRFVPSWRAGAPERATRTALILGVLALVACVVFWTGLPFPLGAGAIMLGLTLRESAPAKARTKATIALGLGVVAVLASFVVLLIG